jgi:hypothetical protein
VPFYHIRECCYALLSNPACDVKDARLGNMCIDIFNNFVHYAAVSQQDLSDEEIFRYNQLFNMVALSNIQLSTGKLSSRLMVRQDSRHRCVHF